MGGKKLPVISNQLSAAGAEVVELPMTAPAPKKGEQIVRRGTTVGRMGQIVTAANRWRETYNPARGLTIRRAVELLEMGQQGDTAYLQWAFRMIERRHPTLSALITRCEAPLLTYDWEVRVKERLPVPEAGRGKSEIRDPRSDPLRQSDSAARGNPKSEIREPKAGGRSGGAEGKDSNPFEEMAKRQQATLTEAYEGLDNLKAAVQHLHLAEFRGYAHLQKHRNPDGSVYHLEPLNQWCVCRDGLEGNWFWNPDSKGMTQPLRTLGKAFCIGGAELPIEDFIIREVERPIDEIALVLFIRSNLAEKDADGFLEIYGIPGGVVIMPANVPQGKEGEYEAAAKLVAEGGSGAIPSGSDYKANDGPRGVDPFTPRLKHLEEQLVLVGTGGKLTMLAESGSGTLAGGAHSDSFNEVAEGRAQKISERLQRDFDAEVLDRKHPGEPHLVYFKLGAADKDSAETVAFKRDLLKGLAGHELLSRVLANQVDLKTTARDSGVAINEEYVDPYVPVVESNGALVTGEVVKDSEGDIVGGMTRENEEGRIENDETPNQPGNDPEPIDDSQEGRIANRDGFVFIDGHTVFVGPEKDETDGGGNNYQSRNYKGLNYSEHSHSNSGFEGSVDGRKFKMRPARNSEHVVLEPENLPVEQRLQGGFSAARHQGLAEVVGARYSHSQNGYVMTPHQADNWRNLAKQGYHGNLRWGKEVPTVGHLDKAGAKWEYHRGKLVQVENSYEDQKKGLPAKIVNRASSPLPDEPGLEASGKRLVVAALESEFEALNARLAAIAEIADPETQRSKLAGVLAELDKFEADLAKDPAVAQAIYKVLAAGMGNGLVEGKAETLKS